MEFHWRHSIDHRSAFFRPSCTACSKKERVVNEVFNTLLYRSWSRRERLVERKNPREKPHEDKQTGHRRGVKNARAFQGRRTENSRAFFTSTPTATQKNYQCESFKNYFPITQKPASYFTGVVPKKTYIIITKLGTIYNTKMTNINDRLYVDYCEGYSFVLVLN